VNIDLLTLTLLVAVVEKQSLARAAAREHIAATAVSKRITDLERAAKVQLFRRHRTGLELLAAGRAFLPHVRVLMRHLAQLDSEVGDHARGVAACASSPNNSAMVQYLPGDLSRLLAAHPRFTCAETRRSAPTSSAPWPTVLPTSGSMAAT
jgi:DNA-binding transcriptional LysR family regulator